MGVQALQNGECNVALAGGVNIITSPNLFHSLGVAGFLSPSGASRAFDSKASGYCRGEGAGAVVLKPLSQAITHGDPISAVILGSAVNQGSNSSPITVLETESQSALHSQVLSEFGTEPMDISYVEAHGTSKYCERSFCKWRTI